MNMIEAVKTVFSKYATFSGRAARPEFWWWALANLIISVVLAYVDKMVFGSGSTELAAADGGFSASYDAGILGTIWALGTIVPGLAVAVRRLHDIDRSGWWLLIGFIPLIGWLILLYWYVKAGTSGANRFG